MTKKKVMVVDDEPDYLRVTKLNLEATGKFEVLPVSDPKEIIQNLHNFKPDIILMDILMPGMNGIDACEMLNKDRFGKRTPIIIVSALGTDKDRLDAYKVGVVDYIIKPAEKEAIVAKIEKALQFK